MWTDFYGLCDFCKKKKTETIGTDKCVSDAK